LLLDHGHPEAMKYPLGMVWDEATLVVERLNGLAATQAVLTQMAVSSMFSKDASKAFTEKIKEMTGVETDGGIKTGADLIERLKRDG
jgi:hypothetical protein